MSIAKKIGSYPDLQVCNVIANCDEYEDRLLHVVGRVGHAGSVLIAPFNETTGVCMTFWAGEELPGGNHRKFLGVQASLDFKVCDGRREIFVQGEGSWKILAGPAHSSNNIKYDSEKNLIVCGGTQHGWLSDLDEKPNATKFWDKVDPGMFSLPSVSGGENKRVYAKESLIKEGEAVAVLGMLKKTHLGLTMVPSIRGGLAIITNQGGAISSCSAALSATSEKPRVLSAADVDYVVS